MKLELLKVLNEAKNEKIAKRKKIEDSNKKVNPL